MIRHVVLLRFRPEIAPEARAALIGELDGLRGRLPGMVAFTAHRNISVEPHVMHGFDDGFVIDLADEAARDAYLADPTHQAIGSRLAEACIGGRDGIVVFDHAI